MLQERKCIDIPIEGDVVLHIATRRDKSLFYEDTAMELAMSPYQLREGRTYAYEFKNAGAHIYQLEKVENVIEYHPDSKDHRCEGTINTGIYVGSLILQVYRDNEPVGKVTLEIRSAKADYMTDYRQMLDDIAEYYTDLVLQQGSPVSQHLEIDPDASSQTLYQRFSFLRSIIDSDSFSEAVHKIIANPIRKWADAVVQKSILGVKRLSRKNIRQIATSKDRIPLPESFRHGLPDGLDSIPRTLEVEYKQDSLDNPENQFIKFVLRTFVLFCSDLKKHSQASERLKFEANQTMEHIYEYLDNQFFRQISSPTHLNMNSPVLQRKEGYREVYQAWLLFDLAAKLNWTGGDTVYDAGKKNVAALYEYWLFFKLLEMLSEFFHINPEDKKKLVNNSSDEEGVLDLNICQGKTQALRGEDCTGSRRLNIAFYYNRTFSKNRDQEDSIAKGGSWTAPMRPDYTLSMWPGDIKEQEAEKQNLITHIHFDAKYRVNQIPFSYTEINEQDPEEIEKNLNKEKQDQELGIYKRADMLKMHAYKDAIRRTSGAYVLYPGTEHKVISGFHEIVPGLGAFNVRPGHWLEDSRPLRNFISEVKEHLLNRISEREELSYYSYKVYQEKNQSQNKKLLDKIPEPIGVNRDFLPDETSVIVGYYKNNEHLDWILKHHMYNMRAGSVHGAMTLNNKVVNARYLLLYNSNNTMQLINIKEGGLRVMTRPELLEAGYPQRKSEEGNVDEEKERELKNRIYLVYDLSPDNKVENEFRNYSWKIDEILPDGYLPGQYNEGKPYPISLIELLKKKHKTIQVVAAIIKDGNRIFATQRGYGEFKDGWEFPGGKMEPGESREEALRREIREELDTEIKVEEFLHTVECDYPKFHLTMHCFICSVQSGDLVLKEHESAKWLDAEHLMSVDWLPADVKVVRKLQERL